MQTVDQCGEFLEIHHVCQAATNRSCWFLACSDQNGGMYYRKSYTYESIMFLFKDAADVVLVTHCFAGSENYGTAPRVMCEQMTRRICEALGLSSMKGVPF